MKKKAILAIICLIIIYPLLSSEKKKKKVRTPKAPVAPAVVSVHKLPKRLEQILKRRSLEEGRCGPRGCTPCFDRALMTDLDSDGTNDYLVVMRGACSGSGLCTWQIYVDEGSDYRLVMRQIHGRTIEVGANESFGYKEIRAFSGAWNCSAETFRKATIYQYSFGQYIQVSTTSEMMYCYKEIRVAVEQGDYTRAMAIIDNDPELLKANYQDGCSLLHAAASNGHKNIVEALLRRGIVDINLKNNQGKTAMKMAGEKGYAQIVDIIGKYGGKE